MASPVAARSERNSGDVKKIMDGLGLPRGASRSLRAHLERRRPELALAILRASGEPYRARPTGRSAFVGSLLDRLTDELGGGDPAELDRWVAETEWFGQDGIIPLTCGIVGASYASEHADGHVVARYLALRGKQLDRAFEESSNRRQRIAAGNGSNVDREELIEAFLASLEARDLATCEHSRAVGMWGGRIAKAMNMTPEEVRFIALCGTLHDIGKLATPKSILLKPGPLDDAEWETMRQHSAIGAELLDRVPSLRECVPVVRAHHERMDGKGYPDHLSGSSIPFAARIVSVADAFHAMISDRPYRPAVPASGALAILVEGRGYRWDAKVVDAILALVRPGVDPMLELAVGFDS